MVKQYGSHRQRKRTSPVLLTLGILLVGLVGGTLLLHATGAIELSFLKKESQKAAPSRKGKTWIPMASRTIPAYSEITSADLVNPRTGAPTGYWLKDEQVVNMGESILKKAGVIVGRVLKKEKPAGYVFSEKEFYPKGTRPGPTAGVPPGKRALRLKASDVPGLHGLKQGDHFDLVMTVTVEVEDEPRARSVRTGGGLDVDGPYAGVYDGQQAATPESRPRVKRQHAEVRTIVNNGIVVQPVMQRKEIGTASSLLRGTKLTATPIEEIIVAVEPKEVAELNFALAIDATLQVAMRSGQVGEGDIEEEAIPPIQVVIEQEQVASEDGAEPVCKTRVIEVIQGGVKSLIAVPEADTSPDAEPSSDAEPLPDAVPSRNAGE